VLDCADLTVNCSVHFKRSIVSYTFISFFRLFCSSLGFSPGQVPYVKHYHYNSFFSVTFIILW